MIAMLLAAAAAPTPVPMPPTSKWNVDYGATACMLGRTYGTGKDEIVMALRAAPLADSFDLMMATRDRNEGFRMGRATIAIDGGRSDDSGYDSYPTTTPGKRMTTMAVDAALFEGLGANAVLTVAPDKPDSRLPVRAFAMPNARAAFAALAKCNDATLAQWGLDPTERQRVAVPAEPQAKPASWITADDYPMGLVRMGAQGTTQMLWTIGVDGRVGECRIVSPSGQEELDKAACRAMTLRGRYVPAKDANGQPMVSHQTRNVKWRLPGAWSGKR